MSRYAIMATAALALLAGFRANSPRTSPTGEHFALILEHSAQGWKATCDTGCVWREVSMSCGGCDVRLSSSGIGRAGAPEVALRGFAFTLSDSASGWQAKAARGVRWATLSFSCPQAVCRAEIDETGVRGR